MLLGLKNLNENAFGFSIESVSALRVPSHLNEEFSAVASLGNAQAESLFEQILVSASEVNFNIQRGISSGNLLEGIDYRLNENAITNFYNKVKELFNKLVAAVKALFQKFRAWLDAKWMDDSNFITKYEKMLRAKSSSVSDMAYKAHEWNMDRMDLDVVWGAIDSTFKETSKPIETAVVAVAAEVAKSKQETPEERSKKREYDRNGSLITQSALNNRGIEEAAVYLLNEAEEFDVEVATEKSIKHIGELCGINVSELSEFKTEFDLKLRGDGGQVELTGPNVTTLIENVKGYSKEKTAIEKAQRSADKYYSSVFKTLDRLERDAKNTPAATASMSKLISFLKEISTLGNSASGIYLTCLKERRTESKGILGAIIGYKKK
ncbi:MAG: hypothetical protein ACRC0G_07675 [Fusobacteriaceae bacterium]